MLSADPVVPDALNAQAWNRYSYVANDPLAFTDPSGYSWLSNFFHRVVHFFQTNPLLRAIAQIAIAAVLTPIVGPIVAAAASAAVVTGLSGGHLGAILRNAVIAGATAFAFNLVGGAAAAAEGDWGSQAAFGFRVGASAAVGCGSALASGGQCGPGALSAGVGALSGPILPTQDFTARLIITAVLGGTASVAGGGKFANGAVTAAFGYLTSPGGGGGNSEAFEDLYNAERPPVRPGILGLFSLLGEVLSIPSANPNENQGPPLPEYDGKTFGVLRTSDTELTFRSGWAGGPAPSMPEGASGYDIVTRTHVEGHAAAWMTQNGVTDATLYINNPEGVCSICTNLLPRMLPAGSNLTVVTPVGRFFFTGAPRW